MRFRNILYVTYLSFMTSSVKGKSLWSSTPASWADVIRQTYPIGNGRLGAMPSGPPGAESVVLNIDSLWSGGPFQSSSYTGGNPNLDKSKYLPGIRDWIFQNGSGNVSRLLGAADNYGSYQVFANISVAINGVTSSTKYNRSLDLSSGIHTTVYTANDENIYTSSIYCTYPDQVCVYDISSNGPLPEITIDFNNQLTDRSLFHATCADQFVRLTGATQLGPPMGMKYDGIARLIAHSGTSRCSNKTTGKLVVQVDSRTRKLTLVIGAGTDYDWKAGNAASSYSFKGADPGLYVESVTTAASKKSENDLRQAHISDYQNLAGQFELDLPDIAASAGIETSAIIRGYSANGTGNPYLESLMFEYGRHLFISSSRDNSLPPNLAGRWSETPTAAWNADYHANINLQMNHWGVDQTGLGELQVALWNYMQYTWMPRGTETAKLLYGAPGWVTHSEMNIFGHTAMKGTAQWANYPASAAWMMQHLYDHFSYSQNMTWLAEQAYPILKGHVQFWLSQLQDDKFLNDGTLVVNPCNSPEHGPTTFACTHFQQLLHQMFKNTLSLIPLLPSPDTLDLELASSLTAALSRLDKGLHISTFGTLKEWKLPDRYGYDFSKDTHRHLSHLVGWYPGHSVSSLLSGYTNSTIQSAVRNSLLNRGPGNGSDADSGWEKVWRSACWALLNDTEHAHYEVRFAISENWAPNGLSMYSGKQKPFQIDANFGLVGAMLAMLVVDLPGMSEVVLGPAIPGSWGDGNARGLRLRGGGSVDFGWDREGMVSWVKASGEVKGRRIVNKAGKVLAET
ncbi:hypothetical protein G7Y89_g2977 [Cudoniella acicularis]|uniref:Glycosyl hydrolase family 95 N-terminal domain-containing protein n=1 Tax=Cudoniella acicularis TaxID=354080 RepID=A0A8H4RSB9_9HELO|nr:hypothetical protein G7Y89_g2977 [Cudoniella acicularis]